MNTPVHLLGLLNLGGGELVLILALLILVVGGPLLLAGVIYLVVRRNQAPPSSSRPFSVGSPPATTATPHRLGPCPTCGRPFSGETPAPNLEQQLRTLAKMKDDGVWLGNSIDTGALRTLAKLKDDRVITEEAFNAMKKSILGI